MDGFNRERIEAAVRAWDREPTKATIEAVFEAFDAPHGFWTVDGEDNSAQLSIYTLSAWLAHVRTLDAAQKPAKPAPAVEADPLAGVVWIAPREIVAWGEAELSAALEYWHRIPRKDRTIIVERDSVHGDARHVDVLAHARAQLAREAAAPAQTLAQADAAPAMTLEQARAMCREAGDTVVTASGYERPDLVLAWLEARAVCDRADEARDAATRKVCDADRAVMGRNAGDMYDEIARLRALGVTPAALR